MASPRSSWFLRLRFWTATAAVFLMNLNVFGFSFRKMCTPGFNCHGCPWATFACPVGVLTFGAAVRTLPVLALSGVMAVGILTGRLVCGFFCPFGWFQDLLHRIPGPKLRLPRWIRTLRYAALALLVVILPWLLGFERSGYLRLDDPQVDKGDDGTVTVTVTGRNLGDQAVRGVDLTLAYFGHETDEEVLREAASFADVAVLPGEEFTLPGVTVPNLLGEADLLVSSPQSTVQQTPRYQLYFCRICPKGTLTASLLPRLAGGGSGSGVYGGGWFSFRYLLLFAFLGLMVVASRPFCRMLCPLGAMYGLLAPFALAGFKVDLGRCTDCRLCDRTCPVGLDVRREIGGPDCIACGDCLRRCPHDCLRRCLLPGRDKRVTD
jgi:ferredoxin